MGKTRIIAETGAGQHGVATATACALFGLPCEVYMGEEDVRRQAPNVGRMRLLGARVIPVTSGLAHAEGRDERGAARLGHERRTTLLLHRQRRGTAPLPRARRELAVRHRRRGARRRRSRLYGAAPRRGRRVRRGGLERDRPLPRRSWRTRASRSSASRRRAKGSRAGSTRRRSARGASGSCTARRATSCATTGGRSRRRTRSAPGLDYPGVGPEHSWLKDIGRVPCTCRRPTTRRSRPSELVARMEGIIPALETSHAFAKLGSIARDLAAKRGRPVSLVVASSGRGDKDLETLLAHFGGGSSKEPGDATH